MALSHPPLNIIESADKTEAYYFAIVDIFTQYGVQVRIKKLQDLKDVQFSNFLFSEKSRKTLKKLEIRVYPFNKS